MKQPTLKLVGNKVAVEYEERPEKIGSIVTPDGTYLSPLRRATVRYLGAAVKEEALKVGQTVIVSDYLGYEFTVNDSKLRIYLPEDVLAILE